MSKFFPFVALALAIALFFLYVRPTYSGSIADLNNAIATDNQALAAASRYTARETELTTERDAIPSDQLDRLQTYLPDSVDTVRLILDLNALASRTGVTLSGYSVAASTDSSSGSTGLQSSAQAVPIDLSVTASGSYPAFRSFLAGLESSLQPFDVTQVSVKNSATGVYTYTLTLQTYSLQ